MLQVMSKLHKPPCLHVCYGLYESCGATNNAPAVAQNFFLKNITSNREIEIFRHVCDYLMLPFLEK